jgi:putative FmdB family regulatory protein
MPLYEYECEACGHRFEVIQKYSDAPVETCPKCSGRVQKQLSSPAIQFKGSGWYITDYARAGKSEGRSDTKSTEGKAETSSESSASKTDSKSESKTESQKETKTEVKAEPKK